MPFAEIEMILFVEVVRNASVVGLGMFADLDSACVLVLTLWADLTLLYLRAISVYGVVRMPSGRLLCGSGNWPVDTVS